MNSGPSSFPRVDTLGDANARKAAAQSLRQKSAEQQTRVPAPPFHATNGDETALPGFIASFSKGLPHSALGEVDPAAYQSLLAALSSGRTGDLERLPLSAGAKLLNPLGSNTFTLMGADSHSYTTAPPPTFSSAATAADMVELYWQAQLRDVNFADYPSSALAQRAAADINRLSGGVTPASLFRGTTPGDLIGPYISQFLLKPVPINSGVLNQAGRVGAPGVDFLRAYPEWLQNQLGAPPAQADQFDPQPRYLRNGRDLAQWVHYDYPQLAFQNAAFIVFDLRPETILNKNVFQLAGSNPYKPSLVQTGFVTFSVVHLSSLISYASNEALHAAWFQKWMVHRRLRPDTMSGRIHNRLTGAAGYPLHPDLLNADALAYTFQQHGTYLLSQAYPESSPLAPSYPSGHAAVAGAGATLMKAFFDENAIVPSSMTPSADGLSVTAYTDAALTVGNEANKLAFNIAMGRCFAGVSSRSDAIAGLLLGEEVAIRILQDAVKAPAETFPGFQFTRFDGRTVSIASQE